MSKHKMIQSILLGTLSLAGTLNAQFINWDPVRTCGADSDIATNGTLVCAYAVNAATTVNGVPFEKAPAGNTGATNWGDRLILNYGVTGTRAFTESRSTPSGVSAAYASLLNGIIWCYYTDDPNVSFATLTLTNLTAGTRYLVQLWNMDRSDNQTTSYRVAGYEGYGAREFGGASGQFATLTFTAMTNTLTLTGFGQRAKLSALQLRSLGTDSQTRLWSGGTLNAWDASGLNWRGYGGGDTLWDAPNGATNHAGMGAAEQVTVPSGIHALGIDAGGTIFAGAGSLTLQGNSFYTGSLVDMNMPLAAPLGLEKRSAGVLSLLRAGNSVTNVSVLEGSLALGGTDYSKLPGLVYHLDASQTNTMTLAGASVSEWRDADGRNISFSAPDSIRRPVYVQSAFGGLGALRFGETVSNLLIATSAARVQTVVIVSRPITARSYMGLWGTFLGKGVRLYSTTAAWQYTVGTRNVFTDNGAASGGIGQMFVNGVKATSANAAFTLGQPQVLTAISEGSLSSTNSIGYYENLSSRYFDGEVAEVYAFSRALTAGERLSLEAALSNKWINATQPAAIQNVLAPESNVDVAAQAQLVLSGTQQQLRSLTGKGIVSGTAQRDSLVTVSNQTDTVFEGTLTGALSLRKTGTGTLTLSGYHTYTGATDIRSGTLAVRSLVPTNGLAVHLDAGNEGTLTLGSGSNVVSWTSKRGDGLSFTQDDIALQPVYVAGAFNGRGGVRFGATVTNTFLKATASRTAQTVFFVLSTVSANRDYAGVWGSYGANVGFRAGTSGTWQTGTGGGMFWTGSSGTLRIDGVVSSNPSIPLNQTQVIGLTRAASVNWTTALGFYNTASPSRFYDGVMGEVMIYDRDLSAEEITSVENYLTGKWKTAENSRLPASTVVTVSSGAILDLGESIQVVRSLAGSGSVTNGTLHVSDVIVPEGTLTLPGNAFAGTVRITPDDSLVLTGDSSVQGLTLDIQDPHAFAYGTLYTVVTCTGVLEGDALPTLTGGGTFKWLVRKVGNTIQIGRLGGTMIRIL